MTAIAKVYKQGYWGSTVQDVDKLLPKQNTH